MYGRVGRLNAIGERAKKGCINQPLRGQLMKQLHNAECLLGTGSDGTRYTPAVSYHNPIARDRFTTHSATEDKFAREVEKIACFDVFFAVSV